MATRRPLHCTRHQVTYHLLLISLLLYLQISPYWFRNFSFYMSLRVSLLSSTQFYNDLKITSNFGFNYFIERYDLLFNSHTKKKKKNTRELIESLEVRFRLDMRKTFHIYEMGCHFKFRIIYIEINHK